MKKSNIFILTLLIMGVVSIAEAETDKSGYHLFNPTPQEQMRELSTDRPDQTESPFTVDAGHIQVELDFINYSYDQYMPGNDSVRVESIAIAPINIKVGILNDLDLQFILQPYIHQTTTDKAVDRKDAKGGFGDITVRLKYNIWGNDNGDNAFALLPYIKLPLNSDDLANDSIEGGIILPFAGQINDAIGIGTQIGIDIIRNEVGKESYYFTEFSHSIVLGFDTSDNFGLYVEWVNAISASGGGDDWTSTFDLGFTYGINEDLQLDGGVNIGLTRTADDFNPFVGITKRF